MIKPITLTFMASVIISGCASKFVPVDMPKPKRPEACEWKKRGHSEDLPDVPLVREDFAGVDKVNKHWAAHYRLKARPSYRRLWRDYIVCSRFTDGI